MKAGWKTVKLGEIALVGAGNSAPQDDADFSTDGPYFVRTSDVGEVKFGTVNSSNDRLSSKGAKGMRLWKAGTILIPKSGASTFVNHRVILGLDAHVSSHLATIQAEPTRCDGRYLLYYLSTVKAQDLIQDQSYPSLKLPEIAGIEIPLPPLAEQKRIVALLDEAFAGIDEAKAKTEDILERTQALFESHLQSIFSQRGHGWVERRLGELSRINYGYTESASSEKVGPHFLRITDIQDDGVDWNTVPYCPIDKGDLPKYKLTDGDIVFARTGATTGKSYLVSNPPDSVFASYLIRVQLSDKALIPGFLYLFFQTRSYWDVIRAGVSGSAQGGFNASKLGELTIPYPASLNDQKAVIHSIAEIQADTLKAGKLSNRKLQALGELRESLLTQAFAGELTA